MLQGIRLHIETGILPMHSKLPYFATKIINKSKKILSHKLFFTFFHRILLLFQYIHYDSQSRHYKVINDLRHSQTKQNLPSKGLLEISLQAWPTNF